MSGTLKVEFVSHDVVDNDGRVGTLRVVSGKRRRGKEVTVKDTGGSYSHILCLSSVLTAATAVDGRS